MPRRILKTLTARSAEGLVAVIIVLIFFMVLLGILNAVFPSGTSLTDMMSREGILAPAGLVEQSVRELFLSSRGEERMLSDPGELAAVLTRTRNDVKSRRANAIAWGGAREGMPLFNRDAVQTLKRATATITFDESNRLEMGENSLIIIQRLNNDTVLREKRSFMVMVEGELRGSIGEKDETSVHVEVATPSAVARIRSQQSESGKADFKISVNPDKSSTIAVYQGVAELTAQGRTVRIEANQAANVKLGEAPTGPEGLPDPPKPGRPSDASLYVYRDLPPRIHFSWTSDAGAKEYRMVIASDPDFRDIVFEDKLAKSGFVHGNLRKGDYYWRVSAIEDGLEGTYSAIRRIKVAQDRTPPALRVQFPPENVDRDFVILTGSAEPGARIFVGGRAVPTEKTGRFKSRVALREGINVVLVEAFDEVGNVTYRSQLVNRKK